MSAAEKKKPDKPKKPKDVHIQIKATGAVAGQSYTATLSEFQPQTKEADEETVTFNFKTKKGKPSVTEGQSLTLDINGQTSNVTVSGKKTTVKVSLLNQNPPAEPTA